jgi:hypothetical protein
VEDDSSLGKGGEALPGEGCYASEERIIDDLRQIILDSRVKKISKIIIMVESWPTYGVI